MKKLFGIMLAIVFLVAPAITFAQVEATAGSMKLGVHMDVAYRLSGESNEDPDLDEIGWVGYDSVDMQDVFIEITGKVGDRISYKILQGLILETLDSSVAGDPFALVPTPFVIDQHGAPSVESLPFEAYVDFKIIDQLKFRFGKQLVPTLIANTGVHQMDVIHTTNAPLIASNSSSTGPVGINGVLLTSIIGQGFVPMPLSVTGAAAIISFSGLELSYTLYDKWLGGTYDAPTVGDLGYDPNKTKGGNVAIGYNGQVGPGKLVVRGFYDDECSETDPDPAIPHLKNTVWGGGLFYNADKFFIGGEYANSTLKVKSDAYDPDSNTAFGYYVVLGGTFSSIQPVYRFDFIDYTDLSDDDLDGIEDIDTEMHHTIGVNYLVNDQTTVGLNYVIKVPEELEDVDYPNANEFSIIVEVDLL